jgi:hypothetical protein
VVVHGRAKQVLLAQTEPTQLLAQLLEYLEEKVEQDLMELQQEQLQVLVEQVDLELMEVALWL